jgi:hypothetical protein
MTLRTNCLLFLVALANVGTLACAASRPPAGIEPQGVPPPTRPETALPHSWYVPAPSDTASYEMELSAEVSTRAATLFRIDTLISHIELTVIPRGAALDISIIRFDVREPTGRPRTALDGAVRVLGRFTEHGGISFEGAGVGECGAPAAAAAQATRDLWVRAPARLRVGDTWSDSTSTTICRDSIWLASTTKREYRVTAAASADSLTTLTIARRTRLLLSGSGELRGEPVEIRASGTGQATLRLSTASGWVVDARGESSLTLEARTPGRIQSVDQALTFRARAQRDD